MQEKSSKTQTDAGAYLPLARIAHKEGGGPSGQRAALAWAMRCTELGGEWVSWCSFTRRAKFLYVVKQREEKHEIAWRKHEEQL